MSTPAMNTADCARALREHALTRAFAEPILTPLAAIAEWRTYAAEDPLFQAGMPSSGLYLICSGTVRVFAATESRLVDIAFLGAGECAGSMSLLQPGKHVVHASCATAATVVHFDPLKFVALSKEKPGATTQLLYRLMKQHAQNLRDLQVETMLG